MITNVALFSLFTVVRPICSQIIGPTLEFLPQNEFQMPIEDPRLLWEWDLTPPGPPFPSQLSEIEWSGPTDFLPASYPLELLQQLQSQRIPQQPLPIRSFPPQLLPPQIMDPRGQLDISQLIYSYFEEQFAGSVPATPFQRSLPLPPPFGIPNNNMMGLPKPFTLPGNIGIQNPFSTNRPMIPPNPSVRPANYGLFDPTTYLSSINRNNNSDVSSNDYVHSAEYSAKNPLIEHSTANAIQYKTISDLANLAHLQHDVSDKSSTTTGQSGADYTSYSSHTNTSVSDNHRRHKRNASPASQEDGEMVCLLDYFLDTTVTNVIRILYKNGHIKRKPNTRTPAIVNALFNDHLSKSCEYRVLKNNESTSCDDQYISELFNHIEWWTENVEINGETFLLVDLILESLLRGVIHWLCDNNWVTSDLKIEDLVNISMDYLRKRQEYISLLSAEENGLRRLLNRDYWWLLEGVIYREGTDKHWLFESEIFAE